MGSKIKVTEDGYSNMKILQYLDMPNAKIVYAKLDTVMFEVPEIGMKGEVFADIPKTNGECIISNKGSVFKKVWNETFKKFEYVKLRVRMDKFVSENEQGKGGIGNYLYCDLEVRGKKRTLWVGRTVAELFVPKPKYIVFRDGLFETKILINQKKLRAYYNDNFGTCPYASNICWTFRNDAGVKGCSEIGNNVIPSRDNGGEKYVVYGILDGLIRGIFNNISDAGTFIGRPKCKGDMITILCKGRTESYTMPNGDIIGCRKMSTLSKDTEKRYINIYNSANEWLKVNKPITKKDLKDYDVMEGLKKDSKEIKHSLF